MEHRAVSKCDYYQGTGGKSLDEMLASYSIFYILLIICSAANCFIHNFL